MFILDIIVNTKVLKVGVSFQTEFPSVVAGALIVVRIWFYKYINTLKYNKILLINSNLIHKYILILLMFKINI